MDANTTDEHEHDEETKHVSRYRKCCSSPKCKRYSSLFKYGISICLVSFSLLTIVLGILDGKSQFYQEVPVWLQLIIFILDLFLLGIMEGIQISIVELKIPNPHAFRQTFPRCYNIHRLLDHEDGVDRFLIGRQISVVFLVFVAALLTGFGDIEVYPFTDAELPGAIRAIFFKSGALGALVVVCIAQLTPQLVASQSPVRFLNLPGMIYPVKVCLFFEWTGISHCSWLLVSAWHKLSGWTGTNADELAAEGADEAMAEFADIESQRHPRRRMLSSGNGDSVMTPLLAPVLTPVLRGLDKVGFSEDLSKFYLELRSEDVHLTEGKQSQGTQKKKKKKQVKNASPQGDEAAGNTAEEPSTTAAPVEQQQEQMSENTASTDSTTTSAVFPDIFASGIHFKSPSEYRQELKAVGVEVPRFLLSPDHPRHIPPHTVALQLLTQLQAVKEELVDANVMELPSSAA